MHARGSLQRRRRNDTACRVAYRHEDMHTLTAGAHHVFECTYAMTSLVFSLVCGTSETHICCSHGWYQPCRQSISILKLQLRWPLSPPGAPYSPLADEVWLHHKHTEAHTQDVERGLWIMDRLQAYQVCSNLLSQAAPQHDSQPPGFPVCCCTPRAPTADDSMRPPGDQQKCATQECKGPS